MLGKPDLAVSCYEKMKAETAAWERGFVKEYGNWVKDRYWGPVQVGRRENGLFYTVDDLEGTEFSAGRNGYRPLLNCCMYASYRALAEIAADIGKNDEAEEYLDKASILKDRILNCLWNERENFFTVLSENGTHSDARELYGYTPWMYGVAGKEQERAWLALREAGGFTAPVAVPFLATSHPDFEIRYEGHACQWNGPSWPLGTSFMLKSLIAYLQTPGDHCVDRTDFFRYLLQYARSQRLVTDDGAIIPWIDENQNPFTGEWVARTMLRNTNEKFRGKDYNHSSMSDLIITGLCGIVPTFGSTLEIKPLLPEGTWDYFCLDGLPYHGREITVLYDKTGGRYGRGVGMHVYVDGVEKGKAENLNGIRVEI